jgi:polyisoprenyl-phosphate glycosyltransferase
MELSIVVPVYREEKNVPEFLRQLTPILEGMATDYEIIFCLDPSPDQSELMILEERKHNPRVKLLAFSRRVGQPMATLAGLQSAGGAAVIVMDVDLQDPPELVRAMVARWREGFDVVLAQRRTRQGEPLIRKIVARGAYWLIGRVAEVEIPENTGDFRLLSRRAVDEINRLKECHGFLRGLVSLVGFKQTVVQFDRPTRFAGRTHYPAIGSIRIGLNGLLCFSTAALRISSILGFLAAGCSLLVPVAYLFLKLIDYPVVWGNPTAVILLTLISGVQLISIGILGEYIGRIYDEVRMRPKFIVDRMIGFPSADKARNDSPGAA